MQIDHLNHDLIPILSGQNDVDCNERIPRGPESIARLFTVIINQFLTIELFGK